MGKKKLQPAEDPKYFEYEPEEVSDDEVFADMAAIGTKPEDIVNADERAKYIKFLETYDQDET